MKSRFSFSQSTDWCSSLALLFLSGTISAWWIFSGGKTVQPPSQRGHLCWDSLRRTGEQTLSRCSPHQMRDLVPAVAEEGNYSELLSHLLLYFCLLSTMLNSDPKVWNIWICWQVLLIDLLHKFDEMAFILWSPSDGGEMLGYFDNHSISIVFGFLCGEKE